MLDEVPVESEGEDDSVREDEVSTENEGEDGSVRESDYSEDYNEEEINENGEDDNEFDVNVDPAVEFAGLGDNCNVDSTRPMVRDTSGDQNVSRVNAVNGVYEGLNLSDEGSEKDNDDEVKRKWPIFRASSDMKNPAFSIGLTFASKSEFRDVVHNYAYNNGKELKFTKNDNERMYVRCKQVGCPFKINLWKVKNALSWRILTFNDIHDGCGWVYKNKMVKSTRVAKRWIKDIGNNSKWTTKDFRDNVAVDEGFHISRKQAYRVMTKAKAVIDGEAHDFFNKIWNYCLEIEKTHPKTTCIVKLSDLIYEGKHRFLRMYFCWDTCKEGYKYCRPIIGVDGCHLKNKFSG